MKMLLVLALVLVPAGVAAQTEATNPDVGLRIANIVYASGVASDYATTYRTLMTSEGTHERNPLVNWLEPTSIHAMFALGIGLDAASVWAWNRYVAKRWPRLAKVGLYVGAAVRIGFAIDNTRRLNRWHSWYRDNGVPLPPRR